MTLHGNDLFHPRSNRITRAALPFTALPAAVSREFSENVPGAGTRRRVAVLPVGIDLGRFRPIPRREARERLGLDPACPYLLFPHDPARPLKRFDRAREAAGDVPLLQMGRVAPDEVPYWINAANAVLVPSQAEGFGLSVIEAIACGVPAFGTPVGIHPVALHGIEGPSAPRTTATRGAPRCARTSRRPTRASRTAPCRAVLGRPHGRARRRRLARPAGGARRGRAYTRISGRFQRRAPPPMNGLLRRLTRRRAATAEESRLPRRRPPSRSTPPSSPTTKVPSCPRRSAPARTSSGGAAATCPRGSTPTASRLPPATGPAAAPPGAGSAS